MLQTHHLKYSGTTDSMFKIYASTIIFNILSLGIYSFWSQTTMRQYLARNFSLANVRFSYLGTGKQLCLGFFKALPLWIILILLFKFFEDTPLEMPYALVLTVLVIYLTFVALYSSLRYRVTHTLWHNMYGHMSGNAWIYGARALGWSLVALLSLGLMLGWLDHNLYKHKFKHLHVGELPVMYYGKAKDLFRINALTLLLAIPTLWLSRIWYIASVRRYVYNHTQIGSFKLCNTETGLGLVKIYVWGFAVTIFSLGILYPLVMQRKMLYIAKHFAVIGDLATLATTPDHASHEKLGEGIYAIMDLETDL